jgi:YesN/AraC family two-component response regulator
MGDESGEASGVGILLVEDEELARTSLSRMLSLKFPAHPVYTAENGQAGLELYRRHLPKLVITDINMPQLNGIEMAHAIRGHDPQTQIILLSAHSEAEHRQDAARIGDDVHYVLKPTDRKELFAVMGRCLERLAKP